MVKRLRQIGALVVVFGLLLIAIKTFDERSQGSADLAQTTSDTDKLRASAMNRNRQSRAVLREESQAKQIARSIAAETATRESMLKNIERIRNCYESQTCNYPQTDPRSYSFAVGRDLRRALLAFWDRYRIDGTSQDLLGELARQYVTSSDGHVQEVAFNIIDGQPPSAVNLAAISDGLRMVPDPTIMKQGMSVLEKYIGTPWEPEVHDFLGKMLATGPQTSSRTVSEGILRFINTSSVESYWHTLDSLPKGTKAASDLQSALDEFERLQGGA